MKFFRRRYPPIGEELARGYATADGRIYHPADVEIVTSTPPKREAAMHLRYESDTDTPGISVATTACGKFVAVAWLTGDLAKVTCGACKRTGLYRKMAAASP